MSDHAAGKKNFNLLIVSIHHDLTEDFLGAIAADGGNELTIGSRSIMLDVVAGDPSEDSSFRERVSRANMIVMMVRFLDVLSLDKIRNVYHYLAQAGSVPKAIFYLRDKGELDFKISCPSCGQKLWLRDTDVGKRGRCPNCSKPFVILSQADHLKTQLLLPENVPCYRVIAKDTDSFRSAIVKLLEAQDIGVTPADAGVSLEALKHATVRIQVQDV
ncbi:MAG: hypothetical protein PHP98_11655 [Kiritimatiellae bacterium]|nr:hypothetical protein [Kiritimatiellia bacterium]